MTVSSPQRTWEQTSLWGHITARDGVHSDRMAHLVADVLARAEPLLAKASTAPTTFTLHDAEHSFRVAQWIVDIVPDDVIAEISVYDLGMMLMSAYLHDIGMTPSEGRVEGHFAYLAFADDAGMGPAERDQFDRWLDDYGDGPPEDAASPTAVRLQRCRELVAAYCRYRHNDWSAAWMRSELSGLHLSHYAEWLDDLVAICASHHEGYRDLIEARFDPKPVDTPSVVVHPRYVATALRVADILDFDPERTPEIVFRHRLVAPGSEIFWHRDHAITIAMEQSSLLARSRPPNAYVHQAVEQLVDSIDDELRCARAVADATHFGVAPGLGGELPHRWDLASSVFRDIEPRNGAYVYINASFRPDTEKLLALLGGVELYSDKFAAVRELLQNAFDAIRQQIAWQQIHSTNAARAPEAVARLHEVKLSMRHDEEGWWLVCKDSGVGMTKDILERRLLVSGAQRRHDVKHLSRLCKEAGVAFAQTGKFGIGVLSYFMLADRLRLTTRRAVAAGDSESTGWQFETGGVGTFGELRPYAVPGEGTAMALRLRDLNHGDSDTQPGVVERFFKRLREYVADLVVETPCTFRLEGLEDLGLAGFTKEAGWFRDQSDLQTEMIRRATPASRRLRQAHAEGGAVLSTDSMLETLTWKTLEGDLADGLGTFRCDLPVFQLPGGPCLGFMPIQERDDALILENKGAPTVFVPFGNRRFGWMGIRVRVDEGRAGRWMEEMLVGVHSLINFTDQRAGSVNVNRDDVRLHLEGDRAMSSMRRRMQEFVVECALEPSVYRWLNLHLAGRALVRAPTRLKSLVADCSADPVYWAMQQDPNSLIWGRVEPPVLGAVVDSPRIAAQSFMFGAEKASTLPGLLVQHTTDTSPRANALEWRDAHDPPNRIVLVDTPGRSQIGALWDTMPTTADLISEREGPNLPIVDAARDLAAFPPEWAGICGIFIESAPRLGSTGTYIEAWNREHPLLQMITSESTSWLKKCAGGGASWSLSTDVPIDQIRGRRDRAATYLVQAISHSDLPEGWDMLVATGAIELAWDECFPGWRDGNGLDELTHLVVDNARGTVQFGYVRPTSSTVRLTGDLLGKDGLPSPSPSWRGSVS